MKLIVGLGNPGKKYDQTRHNVGFMVLDQLANGFSFDKKFNAELVKVGNNIFAKPQTFMNLSGQAVQAILSFYKIDPSDLLVIHDDLDIKLGEFKIQQNRSSAGHNGVQSIIESLGTKDFKRIRIGIQAVSPNIHIPVEDFVLQKFTAEELPVVEKIIEQTVKQIAILLAQ